MKTNLKLFLIIYKTSYDSLMGDVDWLYSSHNLIKRKWQKGLKIDIFYSFINNKWFIRNIVLSNKEL